MAIGSLRQDRAARAIAGFLAEHEGCGGGFRVNPPERSAGDALRIDCRGCGESLTQGGPGGDATPAGAIALSAALGGSGPGPDERLADRAGLSSEPSQGTLSAARFQAPSLRVPPWLGDALIWTAILTVAGTLAVGILRHVDDGQSNETPRLPAPVVEQRAPASPQVAPRSPEPAARDAAPLSFPTARFTRRTEVAGLSIGVPSGWGPASGGGAVGQIALDGTAMLRIFASPAPAPKDFEGGAAKFLAKEHPGAKIAEPQPVKVGGLEATLIRARYRGGVERAMIFTASGTAYLVLARADADAGPRTRSQARRLLRSVRPG